jgi:hypothetical protein
MATELWNEVQKDFAKFYPDANSTFRERFEQLGDGTKTPEELLILIQKLIDQLQKS